MWMSEISLIIFYQNSSTNLALINLMLIWGIWWYRNSWSVGEQGHKFEQCASEDNFWKDKASIMSTRKSDLMTSPLTHRWQKTELTCNESVSRAVKQLRYFCIIMSTCMKSLIHPTIPEHNTKLHPELNDCVKLSVPKSFFLCGINNSPKKFRIPRS